MEMKFEKPSIKTVGSLEETPVPQRSKWATLPRSEIRDFSVAAPFDMSL